MQAATRAAENPNLSFHKADAQTAKFEAASFNVILCSNALIYMLDVPAALKLWAGWLCPGGKLCFNTPQVGRLFVPLKLCADCFGSARQAIFYPSRCSLCFTICLV